MSASWLSLSATIAAFVLSSAYYVVFSEQLAEVSDAAAAGEQPPPWKLGIEPDPGRGCRRPGRAR
jgi:hypothetical protein